MKYMLIMRSTDEANEGALGPDLWGGVVDLGFEQYRFPGFPVPAGETPFSYLSELCWCKRCRTAGPKWSCPGPS